MTAPSPVFIRRRNRFPTRIPVALLCAILQRAPVLRLLAATESLVASSPLAAVLRSAFVAAGSLGALHSVAGASVLASTQASPHQGYVGVPIAPVAFTISSTGAVGSWRLTGDFPPGLSLRDSGSDASIGGPGVLDATTPVTSVNGGPQPSGNVYPVIVGTPTQEGSFTFQLQAWQFGQQQGMASGIFDYTVNIGPHSAAPVGPVIDPTVEPPSFIKEPQGLVQAAGALAMLVAEIPGDTTFQWQRNGHAVPDASTPSFAFTLTPAMTGIYTGRVANSSGSYTSAPVIVGATTTLKVTGSGAEIAANILHPNGNTFDQILLQGQAALFTADPGQVTRTSCVDANNDIVQIEFSGAGTVSVFVNGVSGPAAPVNYNQPDVAYVKGNVGIVVAGADETTNLSVFSVGRANAVNQALFKDNVEYDGVADLAFIAIQSTNGKFGGLRAANASFSATEGFTGLFAPGVQFTGVVYLGDICAFDNSRPTIVVGSAAEILITGGDLRQTNARPIEVKGVTRLKMAAGSTSQGKFLEAQMNAARLEEDGVTVTGKLVVNPGP